MALTITLPDAADRTPLYVRYPRQSRPQPARITLDLETGAVGAESNPHAPSGDDERAYYGVVRSYSVPPEITGRALHRVVAQITPLLERVYADSEVERDHNSNLRPVLGDDAIVAEQEIAQALEETIDLAEDRASVWQVGDWLANSTDGDLGVTAETTDEAITARAAELEAEAEGDDVVLEGDVSAYLRERREALRASQDEPDEPDEEA